MRVRRGRERGMFSNPILVGALTVLVAVVAVSLAYQADNGLPFVPKYSLHLQIPDAEELTHGNEVHMGGALIGLVTSVDPARTASGQPIAVMNMALDKNVEPLPQDSTFIVRLKGSIGLKYLDVTKGHSTATWANGATIPLGHSGADTDLDQLFGMFTPRTRTGVSKATIGFSDALAGRGDDINNAIGAFVPLVTDLGPVAVNLASHQTDLAGFFHGLESFSSAVAPVASTQADLYTNLDTTFKALAGIAYPYLQNWISETPPTFETVISDSPAEQSFLTDTASLFADLRPGFATFPKTAPILADAFAEGARNLPGSEKLDQRLLSLSQTLEHFGQNPTVQQGLNRLTATAHSLRSPLTFLTPAQSTCNYVTLFLRNIASSLSERLVSGSALRFYVVTIDDVLGGEAVASSKLYTKGDTSQADEHGPVHINAYPNTDAPGQSPLECAAGNEPFSAASALVGNPPTDLGTTTEKTTRPKSG